MFSTMKKNMFGSILLGGLAVTSLLLLANSLIKAIFILSNESAVQKAVPADIVLGTLSLGFVLLAIIGMAGALFLIHKTQKFDKHVIMALFGVVSLLIISGLFVVYRDFVSFTTDWKKLNDIEGARANIAKNLTIANTLVNDQFGNSGIINPNGTNVMDLKAVILDPQLQNTIPLSEYDAFVNQVIQSKKDLAALYGVDELLNTAHQPLIAAKLVDGLAAAWQHNHNITASSWMRSTSNIYPYDFMSIIRGGNLNLSSNGGANLNALEFNTTLPIGIAGDAQVSKLISALQNPLVFSGITIAYLQGFPITLTGIVVVGVLAIGYIIATQVTKNVKKVEKRQTIKVGAK